MASKLVNTIFFGTYVRSQYRSSIQTVFVCPYFSSSRMTCSHLVMSSLKMHRLWLSLGGRSLCGSPARRKSGSFWWILWHSFPTNGTTTRGKRRKEQNESKFNSLSDTYSLKLLISDFYYQTNCHFSKIKYEYQSRKYLSYNGEPRVLIAPSFCLRVLCKFTLDLYMPKLVCVGDLTFLTLFFTTIVSF